MRPLIKRLAALLLVSTLSGCSTISGWFSLDDDEVNQPAELVKFSETAKVKRLWSVGVGDGQDRKSVV